ncbi:MAG: hypothetical protein AB4058_08280 [Microcystaceae cyanobacterium]
MFSPNSLDSLLTKIQLHAVIHHIPATVANDFTLLNILRNDRIISKDNYYDSIYSIIHFNCSSNLSVESLYDFSNLVTTLCNEYFCESFLAQLS